MKTVKVEIEAPDIEGYEYTGEYRLANHGEYYVFDTNHVPHHCKVTRTNYPVLIMRKKRWRAEIGGTYYVIVMCTGTPNEFVEEGWDFDSEMWELGNYFKTRADAEAAMLEIKNVLKPNG